MTSDCLLSDGETNRERVSAPYSLPKYHINSDLQLAITVILTKKRTSLGHSSKETCLCTRKRLSGVYFKREPMCP